MTYRRLVLTRSAAVIGAASSGLLLPSVVRAQSNKVRVGFMLTYTGTFAQLGVAIENGFRMTVHEQGGKLGGREIEFFKVDDEPNPAKGKKKRQPAGAARQGRCAHWHGSLGRADDQGDQRRQRRSSEPKRPCMPP